MSAPASPIRKFAFDTEFAADGSILHDAAGGARRFSAEDLEAARVEGYARGRDDALVAAERAAEAAINGLDASTTAVLQKLDAEIAVIRAEAARVAAAAARKIADKALDAFGEERAFAAVEAALDLLRHGPRLVVRVPESSIETLKPRLDALAAEHRYPGAIVVRAEPGLPIGGVILDWSDGMISVDPRDVAARVEAAVEGALGEQT